MWFGGRVFSPSIWGIITWACQRGCEGEAAWGAGRSCAPRGGLSRRAARTGAVCLRARLPGAADAAAARAVCETVASTRLHLQQGFSAGGVRGERARRKRTAGPGRPACASPRPPAGATGGGPGWGGTAWGASPPPTPPAGRRASPRLPQLSDVGGEGGRAGSQSAELGSRRGSRRRPRPPTVCQRPPGSGGEGSAPRPAQRPPGPRAAARRGSSQVKLSPPPCGARSPGSRRVETEGAAAAAPLPFRFH